MVAAELDRHPGIGGSAADSGRVGVPAFEHPAAAIGGDLPGGSWPEREPAVQAAGWRVVEEDVVQAIAARPLQPRRPGVVQCIVAEDQRPPRESGLLPVAALGELPGGDEPGAALARFDPGKAELFEQPVNAVQAAARIVSTHRQPGGAQFEAEPIGGTVAGDDLDLARRTHGHAEASKVMAQFAGSSGGWAAWQGSGQRPRGQGLGGEGHPRRCYRSALRASLLSQEASC